MNLLELLLEQNTIWPVGMRWAVQDKDGEIRFACKATPKPPVMEVWDCRQETIETKKCVISSHKCADDWRTRIVDCNEYRAAGGWMCWKGGERPVPKETTIEYKARGGGINSARAGACSWFHLKDECDIVAYRTINLIPKQNTDKAATELAQLYAKLGVTTLEEAFAEIDKGTPATTRHTIVHGPDTFNDCIILLRSRQTVVWGHNGKEYISTLSEVLIDPNKDELVAYLLSGLYKIQIDPAHIAEVRDQVHWVYRENQ